jgi:hypothetical protein
MIADLIRALERIEDIAANGNATGTNRLAIADIAREALAAHRSQSPAEGDDLAEALTAELFDIGGNGPADPCGRLQFMLGRYPDHERPNGGLNRHGLLRVIQEVIAKRQPQPKGIADNFRGARRRDAAEATLQRLGYQWHGAELWEPPLGQAPAPVAAPIKWTLDGDKKCVYNNWLGETPFGRILITWKGWKEYHDACVDEFPGDFQAYGSPDEVKAACDAEYRRRTGAAQAPAVGDAS